MVMARWSMGVAGVSRAKRGHRLGAVDADRPPMLVAWEGIGEDGCRRLREIVRPFSRAIAQSTYSVFNDTMS